MALTVASTRICLPLLLYGSQRCFYAHLPAVALVSLAHVFVYAVASSFVAIDIDAPLSTGQEILGGVVLDAPSQGSGVGSVQYNPNNRVLKWDIQTQDLSSALTQLHFHGPATRVMGGPLQVRIPAVYPLFTSSSHVFYQLYRPHSHTQGNPGAYLLYRPHSHIKIIKVPMQ